MFLLDTQIFLWAWEGNRRLKAETRKTIAASRSFVSVASAWEVAIKTSIGKLTLQDSFESAVDACGFEKLGISFRHAELTTTLPHHHRDPFDRLLVAQAFAEGLTLLTADAQLASYAPMPVRVLR